MVGIEWMTNEDVNLTEKRWLRSPYDPKLNVKLFALRMLPKREGESPNVFKGVEIKRGDRYFLGGDCLRELWIPKSRFISVLRDSLARGARREPTELSEEVDFKVAAMLETG